MDSGELVSVLSLKTMLAHKQCIPGFVQDVQQKLRVMATASPASVLDQLDFLKAAHLGVRMVDALKDFQRLVLEAPFCTGEHAV